MEQKGLQKKESPQVLRNRPLVTTPREVTKATTIPFEDTTRKEERYEAIGVGASEDEQLPLSHTPTILMHDTPIQATDVANPQPATIIQLPETSPCTTTESSENTASDRLTSPAAILTQPQLPVEETEGNNNKCLFNGSTDHPRNTYTIRSHISISSDAADLSDSSTPPLSSSPAALAYLTEHINISSAINPKNAYCIANRNINLPVTLVDEASHNTSYFQYLTVDRASNPHSRIPCFVPGLLYHKPSKPFNQSLCVSIITKQSMHVSNKD